MVLTITKRISIGVALMLFFSGMLSLLLYADLKKLIYTLEHVMDIEEPISAAAYEMEINMLEIGVRVMKYRPTKESDERAFLAKDIADFEKFHASYTLLANDPKARTLGTHVQTLHDEFKNLDLSSWMDGIGWQSICRYLKAA